MRNHVRQMIEAVHDAHDAPTGPSSLHCETPTERLAGEAIRLARLASGVHVVDSIEPRVVETTPSAACAHDAVDLVSMP